MVVPNLFVIFILLCLLGFGKRLLVTLYIRLGFPVTADLLKTVSMGFIAGGHIFALLFIMQNQLIMPRKVMVKIQILS